MSLRIHGVSAAPGGAPVLRGVDLVVGAGSCTAVLGPSGAGKTTLLRVVAGLEPATAGRVVLDGDELHATPPERRDVAVVFQDARLFPAMDVADNVAFPLRMAGVGRDERTRRAAERLAEVGLAGFERRRPRDLSGGEAQRVALARALVGEPAALLLDEPFAAVDPERRDELRALVDRLRRDHDLTTLLVTHDRDDAAMLGDRIGVLLDGRIRQEGPPREVFDRPATEAVARFVGCDVLVRLEGVLHATRPERVVLGRGPHRATVVDVRPAADHARVDLELLGQPITARCGLGDELPAVGASVAIDLPGAHPLGQDGRTPTDALGERSTT